MHSAHRRPFPGGEDRGSGRAHVGQLVIIPPACCNGLVHFNPYGGAAAQIAAALVNAGPDATASDFTGLLRSHDYRPLNEVTFTEAADLRAWSARLRLV